MSDLGTLRSLLPKYSWPGRVEALAAIDRTEHYLTDLRAERDQLAESLGLDQVRIEGLEAERDALAARVKELENRPQGIGDGDIRKALDERDQYREVVELILRRNKLMTH